MIRSVFGSPIGLSAMLTTASSFYGKEKRSGESAPFLGSPTGLSTLTEAYILYVDPLELSRHNRRDRGAPGGTRTHNSTSVKSVLFPIKLPGHARSLRFRSAEAQ